MNITGHDRVIATKVFKTCSITGEFIGEIRYFVAIGFAGFKSPANNRRGYESPEGALAASLRYELKGFPRNLISERAKQLSNSERKAAIARTNANTNAVHRANRAARAAIRAASDAIRAAEKATN
jgi:hypothetical protein